MHSGNHSRQNSVAYSYSQRRGDDDYEAMVARRSVIKDMDRAARPLRASPAPSFTPQQLMSSAPPPVIQFAPPPSTKAWVVEGVSEKYLRKAPQISKAAMEIVAEVKESKKRSIIQAVPLWNGLKAFILKNDLGHLGYGEAMVTYVIHRKKANKKLKASSAHTYCNNLRSIGILKQGTLDKEDHQIINNYMAMLSAQSMAETTEHAADVTTQWITTALKKSPSTKIKMQIWAMSTGSPRHEDCINLNDVKYIKKEKAVIFEYGVRKNARFKLLQSSTRYDVPSVWLDFVTEKEIAAYDWSSLTRSDLTELNKYLGSLPYTASKKKGAKVTTRIGKKKPTSYSLRRHAIQRFVAANTDKDGNVDWPAVTKLSGHLSPDMPDRIYTKTAREIADTELETYDSESESDHEE